MRNFFSMLNVPHNLASHTSTSYSIVWAKVAWLKTNYPGEFMVAVTSDQGGDYSSRTSQNVAALESQFPLHKAYFTTAAAVQAFGLASSRLRG